MESERIEEYLEAIYRKQNVESPVITSTLAEELKVSLPAVTDMLQKLEKKGLIEYTPNRGAILTEQGKKIAVLTVRRHRLWERFLTDILGLRWDKVDEEACRLEHATSPATEKGLLSVLGDVDTCPHGHRIPDKDGTIKEEESISLWDIPPGKKVLILSVTDEDPKLLRKIQELGLKPKTVVMVTTRKDNDTLELQMAEKVISLPKKLAIVLHARLLTKEENMVSVEEINLTKLINGESGILKSISGGRGILGRCLSLGFTPGSLVKMTGNFGSGPVLVKIHDTEVALGRGVAEKVLVTRSKMKC